MKPNARSSTKRYIRPVCMGLIAGIAVCAALLIVISFVMVLSDLPYEMLALITTVIFVISGLAAGFVCANKARERGMLVGIFCGLCLIVILCICNLAVYGASFGLAGFTKMICVLISSALGGVIGVNKRKKTKLK